MVSKINGVLVTSPYDSPGKINPSGTTAFAAIDATMRSQAELLQLGTDIQDIGDKVNIDGLQIEYGGEIFAGFELPASEVYQATFPSALAPATRIFSRSAPV